MSSRVRSASCLAGLLVSLISASALLGQTGPLSPTGAFTGPTQLVRSAPAPAMNAFGTASSILSVGMSSFIPPSSTTEFTLDGNGSIHFYQTSTDTANWLARLNLPTGAVLDSIELDACDSSATGSLHFGLGTSNAGAAGGAALATPTGDTGTVETPGCGLFSVAPLSPPLVIDNAATNYWLFVAWDGSFSIATEVAGMRVRYHLQVSPDPATATFNDVPVGHPQHRFIEALVAAGVTAGCGNGNYCPTLPVTRGQMAVFLSVALGLNFPN